MDILNVGAGNRIIDGAVNHDRIIHRPEIDVAHDLNELPWPWDDEAFDKVLAIAVLEHLRLNLVESFNEIWRLLRPGGVLYVKLPHWKHDNSYIDPTHYWQFSTRVFEVFDPDTVFGQRYRFYTDRKWKIVKPARLNNARTSFAATLEVRK
jgi:SAM-dependent methyltransferase